MTVLALLREAAAILTAEGVPDAALDAEYLLADVLHMPRLEMKIDKNRQVDAKSAEAFRALVSRRAKREPLQYILGVQYFYGLPLKVTPQVLIPRADTESVCERALQALERLPVSHPRVLDLCTGSGALAIAIKKNCPRCAVSASDISPDALKIAEKNAALCGAQVDFFQGDLFTPFADAVFDLIVSNPPYIPEAALETLQEEVQFEPRTALCGGGDGLEFYRRIIKHADHRVSPGGFLIFECGDMQTAEIEEMLREREYCEIASFRDLSGHMRGVAGRRKL